MNYETGDRKDRLIAIEAYDAMLRGARVLLSMGRWDEIRFRAITAQAQRGKADELDALNRTGEATICRKLAAEAMGNDLMEGLNDD